MAETKVKIEGLEKLNAKLNSVQAAKIFKDVMTPQAKHIQGVTSKYPRLSSANRPNKKGRWYERGYGPRWLTKQGVHGYKTSEILAKNWKVTVTGTRATISNTSSYAEYVHGERQARFHRKRGWKKLTTTIKDNIKNIEKSLKAYTDRLLSK